MRVLIFLIFGFAMCSSSSISAQVNSFFKTYISGSAVSVINNVNDENIIIGNSTIPVTGGPTGMRLIKTDNFGDTLWTKLYGNVDKNTEGQNVIETSEGDFIVSGIIYTPEAHSSGPSDILLSKLNTEGDTLWWHTYNINNSRVETANDLTIIDNSIYIVGRNNDNGLLLRTDLLGNLIFAKTFKIGSGPTEFTSLQKIDDNIFIFGSVSTSTPDYNIYSKYVLLKTNLNGDSLSNILIGEDSSEVVPTNLIKTSDGNFIFSGYSHSFPNQNEYTLISKFSNEGVIIWEKQFDFYGGELLETSDSCIVFYVNGTNNVKLIKLQDNNDVIWTREIPITDSQEIRSNGITESKDGGLIVTGYVTYPNEQPKIFLLKTDKEGLLTHLNLENNFPNTFTLSQNYPNPFNPSTKISFSVPKKSFVTIKVYDILGKEIAMLINSEKSIGNYELEFNGSSLSSGIYFYRMQAGDFVDTKKLILLK